MNRYTYKNTIEYQKYCIKELLKIKKYDLLNKIRHALNSLKDLFRFKDDIQEYYKLDIRLSNYMPEFYSNSIYEDIYHNNNRFLDMNLNTLNNALFYINKTINAINKKINDLYYTLI